MRRVTCTTNPPFFTEKSLLLSPRKSVELSPRVGADVTVRGSGEEGTGMLSLKRAELPESVARLLIFPGTVLPFQVDVTEE